MKGVPTFADCGLVKVRALLEEHSMWLCKVRCTLCNRVHGDAALVVWRSAGELHG